MSMKNVVKVALMLVAAVVIAAFYCYARVDLGLSLEQINAKLANWIGSVGPLAALVWSVIIVAAVGLPLIRWGIGAQSRD